MQAASAVMHSHEPTHTFNYLYWFKPSKQWIFTADLLTTSLKRLVTFRNKIHVNFYGILLSYLFLFHVAYCLHFMSLCGIRNITAFAPADRDGLAIYSQVLFRKNVWCKLKVGTGCSFELSIYRLFKSWLLTTYLCWRKYKKYYWINVYK